MKRHLVILILIGCSTFIHAQRSKFTYCDSVFVETMKFGSKKFEKRKFSTFTGKYPKSDSVRYTFIERKPFVLSGVLVNFCESLSLLIEFSNIRHQPKFSNISTWDFELLKKEKMSRISIIYKGKRIAT